MSATIYHNARIHTVDPTAPWASAMLVEHGIIQAIGELSLINDKAPAGVERVDLGGRMVMPGIHDAHTHMLWAAARQLGYSCNLDDPQTLEELATQLKAYWKGKGNSGWLIASVYNPLVLGPELLTREWLDNVIPGVAICLHDFSFHNVMVNSAVLAAAGIDRDTIPPPGGVIIKDPLTGEPTGVLREAAWARIYMCAPARSADDDLRALKHGAAICNRYGITSAQEASAQRSFLQAAQALDIRGELGMHLICHIPWGSEVLSGCDRAAQEQLIAERGRYASDRVHVDAIKVALDGTSMAPTFSHVPLDPVTDQPVTYNLLLDSDELVEKIGQWTVEGMIVKSHCTGYGSVRIGLDNYEQAAQVARRPGQLHDIAHAHYVSPRDRGRFAELGVVAEMSPAIWHIPEYQQALGKAYDFRTLLAHGALMTVGTDWMLPPTPNLFPALAGMLDHGDESIPLTTALQLMTLNGAIAVGQQDRWGSLRQGLEATFIVLDRNLFEVGPREIADTQVLTTVFQGRIVYSQETEQP
ncbi:amidohydrolase [Pantoea sp. Tr-811]|uniref:amidohydrolase n=1 Tax=Pantoea sp. Tr-811 TaxID=2608361 RepID=UPI0014212BA9|nr:amidohydrolase [Pantoea sp. Tr-811]NIF28942.1 amidohydrolase [Pantoea sp. Tr-811]